MTKRKSLIVGINYPGTKLELKGSENDAQLINQILKTNYGFDQPIDNRVLLSNDATKAAIQEGLRWLASDTKSGDTVVFYYSGHGAQVRTLDFISEPDWLDEVLCPVDFMVTHQVITDNDLSVFTKSVPTGVNLTMIIDSCHSGGMVDYTATYSPVLNAKWGNNGVLISSSKASQLSFETMFGTRVYGAATHAMASVLETNAWKITYSGLVTQMGVMLKSYGVIEQPELSGDPMRFETEFLI